MSASAEHILQHAVANHGCAVELNRRPSHRQIEMPRGLAPGAQLGAVGVALVIHRQRLVARPGIHAEPDMGDGVGLAVAPGSEIGLHYGSIGALADRSVRRAPEELMTITPGRCASRADPKV